MKKPPLEEKISDSDTPSVGENLSSRRERKKDATRRALIKAAKRRFATQGFDATTIDELCADAGVGRRTFFRYFANKEALAFPQRAERLIRFRALLDAAPLDQGPLDSLRQIAQLFAHEYAAHRQQLLAQQRLIESTPTLQAREQEIDRDWEQEMANAFVSRLSGPDVELRARMLAGAAIGLIRATMRHWYALEGRADLGQLGNQALDALQDGFLAVKK